MLIWSGVVILLASAHAQPANMTDDASSERAQDQEDLADYAPVVHRPARIKARAPKDQAAEAVNPESGEELMKAQRKLSGQALQSLLAGSVPMARGLLETLHNYAVHEINSNQNISRKLVFLLEASKFITEMMDFFSKRGNVVINILKAMLHVGGRILGLFAHNFA